MDMLPANTPTDPEELELMECEDFREDFTPHVVPAGAIYRTLKETEGNLSETAKRLNMRRSTLKARVDRSPALRGVVEEFRDDIVDAAEESLRDWVRQKDPSMTRFALSTLGKDRGYTTAGVNKDGQLEVVIRTFGSEGE